MSLSFLENLPSRGTLVAVQPGAAFTAPPPAYIADHDTAPQQVVKNDQTSVLIRTLQNKKAKEEAKRKQTKAADKGKRPAAAAADDGEGGGRASKRPAAAAAGDGAGPSGAAGSSVPDPGQSSFTRLGLVQKTIKELQNVLKAWNLPVSGKKDDLIQRILDHQKSAKGS
ncbi:SAP domain-containing [Chlorella sorokiniana]|uniref:SAP domain-containing n=1 Tax=Chlorella sorokiniana TaxID=3076 RepID=A0A2P6TPP8_CHLSO|nr:SAP domain-containing [Chlorella sorokiniana]|eukprot:PRW56014.1 SAP domain-containing [Chlorella sorokiniana]